MKFRCHEGEKEKTIESETKRGVSLSEVRVRQRCVRERQRGMKV